ncbi:hypothetical protein [Mesorhizobium australicum]|uniref:hypothetical protein n=1 Tax=Mesorhizobium australicum TaxID=536018 RepID=UPI003339BD64
MSSLVTQTRKKLGELASPEEFELLVTAVLRAADPDYASLIHVGLNDAGRAIISPIDGIDIRVYRGGRRLLLVQHTITARKDLRRKWLYDQRGDVPKARAISEKELARGAVCEATLVLTCATDPDQELIRDANAAAGKGLRVDFWTASRIADFLDRNPEGQWLREQQFGTPASRLSASQARTISRQSLDEYLPLVDRADMIPRALDDVLGRFARETLGAGFIIGESGLGKSAALRRLGDTWHTSGGIVFLLSHMWVEQASGIELAITLALRHWSPSLDLSSGATALSLATPDMPVLLMVEDVNQSSNPNRIIERLLGWSATVNAIGDTASSTQQWRLLCPVWRGNAGLSDMRFRDRVVQSSIVVDRFERAESVEAIGARALAAGTELTTLQCDDLACALGDDPLLIGLNQNWESPGAHDAIQSYVTANINEAADDRLLASDLRHALDALAEKLVEERTTSPDWQHIRRWFSDDQDTIAALRRLIDRARIIRLGAEGGGDTLGYRHDRVRDHLLTQAMVRLISSDRLRDDTWAEPFYTELIGGALAALTPTAIERAAKLNPVAPFAALQDSRLTATQRQQVLGLARAWTASGGFNSNGIEQQRHHAMRCLARTDGDFVIPLARQFPFSLFQYEALIRNGSAKAAAAYCVNSGPGTRNSWRDRMIAHALSRHSQFIPDLASLINDTSLTEKQLEGALNLSGELGDPALCNALAARWSKKPSLTEGWLWAVLRCCPPIGHPLADTLFDVWAQLPTKVRHSCRNHDSNPRKDIAVHSLPFGFARKPEPSAVAFLIARAKQERALCGSLSWILSHVDLPEAVLFAAQFEAKLSRRAEKTGGFHSFSMRLERQWSPDQRGRALSAKSRSALERVWRNRRRNAYDRKAAFLIWRQTPTRDELTSLAALEADPVLADAALRTRLKACDQTAVPLLKQRIWNSEHGNYWWFNARGVGLCNLHDDVQRYLEERRADPPVANRVTDADTILAELLLDENDAFAEEVIDRNWDQLKSSPVFVQAALYLATPKTLALAHSTIAETDAPQDTFALIDSHWGIKTTGRKGITSLAQLRALEPYYVQISKLQYGELYVSTFFESANRLGALEWRKRHLDPIIKETKFGDCPSNAQALFTALDQEVRRYIERGRPWFAIDYWFERREAELWERNSLIAVISEWVHDRASVEAVELLCEALLYFGERRDLTLFDGLPSSLREACVDAIANCVYDVRRRSLGP